MILKRQATPRRLSAIAVRVAALLGALSVGLLASCGGGTSQYDPFVPKRLIVFGDEDSAITPTGRSYSVNGVDASGNFDCSVNPIWVQQLAGQFGFTFAECNPSSVFQPEARTLAFAGAKVADVAAQVEAQVAAGGLRDKDLATVLAGTNDLLELYTLFPSRDQASLVAEAGARGKRLAQVVNRLVDLGAKVIVSDLPDLGLTPYARAQDALGFGNRGALLTALTSAFNEQLGVNVLLDGRFVGLVQAQLRFQAINRSPGSFVINNLSDAACTVALPNCTTATLVPDANAGAYVWADDRRLAPGGHRQLAELAVDRARRNPF